MAFDAARYVHRYYASLAPAPGNEYPRLRAWEYLWEYVWDPSRSWDDPCRALYPRRGLTSVNGGTLTALHRLIGEERLSFPRLETARKGLLYPTGRLADMAFFQYGLENA